MEDMILALRKGLWFSTNNEICKCITNGRCRIMDSFYLVPTIPGTLLRAPRIVLSHLSFQSHFEYCFEDKETESLKVKAKLRGPEGNL